MEDRGSSAISTDEQVVRGANGWVMLAVLLVALALAVPLAVVPGGGIKFVAGVLLFAVSAFSLKGLFTLEPNQAAVMIFSSAVTPAPRATVDFSGSTRFTPRPACRCASTTGTRRC